MRIKFLIIILLSLILYTPSIFAESNSDARLKNLEQKVSQIQSSFDTNSQNVAEALLILQQVRGEFQELKGALQETNYYVGENKKEKSLFFEDVDQRISQLEDMVSLFTGQIEDLLSSAVGPKGSKKEDKFSHYRKGLSELNSRQYKTAIAEFREFRKGNENGHMTGNAQYWIGECHFAMKDYKLAIAEFQKLIEAHPRNSKVPNAMLKQGFSFHELKSYPEAEAFLQDLIAKFPKSPEAHRARERLKVIRRDILEKNKVAEPEESKEK